jgi:hypothetical protein
MNQRLVEIVIPASQHSQGTQDGDAVARIVSGQLVELIDARAGKSFVSTPE